MSPLSANSQNDAGPSRQEVVDIHEIEIYNIHLSSVSADFLNGLESIVDCRRIYYGIEMNDLRRLRRRENVYQSLHRRVDNADQSVDQSDWECDEAETNGFLNGLIPVDSRLESLRDVFLRSLEPAFVTAISNVVFFISPTDTDGEICGITVPGWMLTTDDRTIKKVGIRDRIKSLKVVRRWRGMFIHLSGEKDGKNPFLQYLAGNTETLREFFKYRWPERLGRNPADEETWEDGIKSIFLWELPSDFHSATFTCVSYKSSGGPLFLKTQNIMPRVLDVTAIRELAGTYGRIWHIRHNSICLSTKSLCFILSQMHFDINPTDQGHSFDRFRSASFFLNAYVGPWSPGRPRLSRTPFVDGAGYVSLQYHYRLFCRRKLSDPALDDLTSERFTGLRCDRIAGRLPRPSEEEDIGITESRCSISITSSYISQRPIYSITYLSDTTRFTEGPTETLLKDLGFAPCGRLTGISLFLATVFDALYMWESEWSGLLDEIDSALEMELSDILDHEGRRKLMFDDTLERLESYFTVLQLLPVCRKWIEESQESLVQLHSKFTKSFDDHRHPDVPQEDISALHENWEKVLLWHSTHTDNLLGRMAEKCKDVEGAREGLVNVTALREASKATSLNRYILVFTVATIFYLPLGFVATIFGMDLFKAEDRGKNKKSFYITIVTASIVTYLLSGIAIFGLYNLGRLPQNKPIADDPLATFHTENSSITSGSVPRAEKASLAALFHRRRRKPAEDMP